MSHLGPNSQWNLLNKLSIDLHECHKWPVVCSSYHSHLPVFSSFIAYHRVYTTGATSGPGTANPSGAHEFTPSFSGVLVIIFSVLCMFCLSFCPFSFDHCYICPDYTFGICKLFSINRGLTQMPRTCKQFLVQ